MINILLIGAGGIGKRHLEALIKMDIEKHIYIFDTSISVRKNIIKNYNFKFIKIIDKLIDAPDIINICVVATTAKSRLSVITEITKSKIYIQFLILEKVLCQSLGQLYEMKRLLNLKNIEKIFVNQWFRRWLIKSNVMKKDTFIKFMSVKSLNWDLMCNSLHFIDPFQFFTRNRKINNSKKSHLIMPHETKRKGFFDVYGDIYINSSYGSYLEMHSESRKFAEFKEYCVDIKTTESSFEILISKDNIALKTYLNDSVRISNFGPYLISNENVKIYKEILKEEDPLLPTFKESYSQHKLLFELASNVKEWKKSDLIYPIT